MRTKPTIDKRAGNAQKMPYREKPRSLGKVQPKIDITKAIALAGELEDEEILRKSAKLELLRTAERNAEGCASNRS